MVIVVVVVEGVVVVVVVVDDEDADMNPNPAEVDDCGVVLADGDDDVGKNREIRYCCWPFPP